MSHVLGIEGWSVTQESQVRILAVKLGHHEGIPVNLFPKLGIGFEVEIVTRFFKPAPRSPGGCW